MAWTVCGCPGCSNQAGGISNDCGSSDASHNAWRIGMPQPGTRLRGTMIGKDGRRVPITPPPGGGKPKPKGKGLCSIVLLPPVAAAIALGVTLLRRRT
jgi:hypothetical protein